MNELSYKNSAQIATYFEWNINDQKMEL